MGLDALEGLITVLREVTREQVSGHEALLRVRPVLADLRRHIYFPDSRAVQPFQGQAAS